MHDQRIFRTPGSTSNNRGSDMAVLNWMPIRLNSYCLCLTLRGGVGILAVLDIIFGSLRIFLPLFASTSENCNGAAASRGDAASPSDVSCTGGSPNFALLVVFAGAFTLASGALGLYAVSYERLHDARMYLWTRFVLIVPESLELLVFVLYGNSLLGLVGHVKDMMVFLYQTLVVWSYYVSLKNATGQQGIDEGISLKNMQDYV